MVKLLRVNNIFRNLKKRGGSASIAAIMVLSLLTVSCVAVEKRLSDYTNGEWVDVKSENLLRKAEGATIITEEKIIEATQRLYDRCSYRNEFKTLIESYSYRKQYVSEVESLSDVNLENINIDLYGDNIEQDGSGLYKFWVHITAFDKKYNMQRKIYLCVSLKNLLKDKPIKEENQNGEVQNQENNGQNGSTENPDNKPENSEKPEEDIPQKIDARDALIFRVERE